MVVSLQSGAGPFVKFVVFTGPFFVSGTTPGCPAEVFIPGDITVLTQQSTEKGENVEMFSII